MKKNVLVFCLMLLLTSLLFGCNGIPALASSKESKHTLLKTKEVAKKKTAKKKKNVVSIKNYIKNGEFDYFSYAEAVKMDVMVHDLNLDFIIGEYFIEISSSGQSNKRYYIEIGFLSDDRKKEDLTYLAIFDDWGDSVKYANYKVSYKGLLNMQKVINWVKKQKNPDPYSAPKLKKFKWHSGDELDELTL